MVEIFCGKCYDTVTQYTEMECEHQFCYNCVDPHDSRSHCFKCKANRRRYVERMNIVAQKEPNNCIVCEERIKEKEFVFSCTHPFCEKCLSGFWTAQMREGYMRTLNQFRCPHCKDSSALDEETIKLLLPINLFILISDRQITKAMTICPSCDHLFNLKNKGFDNCPRCQSEICCYCREIHNKEVKCFEIDYEWIFEELLQQDVRYCPSCNDPYTKDNHCDNVTCLNCQKEFCYFCMVDLIPIKHHGTSRHRVDCRNYDRMDIHNPNECGLCQDCYPPQELMSDFVDRKKHYMKDNFRDFYSAPGWGGNGGADVGFGFFD